MRCTNEEVISASPLRVFCILLLEEDVLQREVSKGRKMEDNNKDLRRLISGRPKCFMIAGSPLCAGCQHGTISRIIGEVIDDLGIVGKTIAVGGVGCHSMLVMSASKFDLTTALHGRAPALGTGIKRGTDGKAIVFTLQGDGDLAAIGMGDLINATVRGEKLTTIFFNNAGYGTTGGQMAPTTLIGQTTTTTPSGRSPDTGGFPIHVAELMAGLAGVAYSARCAVNTIAQYKRTKKAVRTAFQKQIDNIGYGFVEILSACPPLLKMRPTDARKWFEKHMFAEYPLGEFKNVDETKIQYQVET